MEIYASTVFAAERDARADADGRRTAAGVSGTPAGPAAQGPPPDAPGQRGQRGGGPPPPSFPSTDPVQLPLNLFQVPDGLEVTLWATTPMVRNPDEHRHRQGRPHLGGGGRALPLAPRAPARGRPHRRAAGHRRRRQGRQHAHVRAGAGARSRRSASPSSTTRSSSRSRPT